MFAWLHKEQLQLNPFWGESVFQCTLRVIVVESASHDARIASTRADNAADPVISRLELCSAAGTMLEIGWNEWECLFVWGWRRLVSFTSFSFTLQPGGLQQHGLWQMWWRGWTDWSGSKQLPGEKKCPCAAGTWLDTTYHLIISWKEGQHIFGVVEKLAEPFHRREDICMKLQADGFLRRVKPMSRLFNVVQKPPDTLFTQSQKCLQDLWADAIITEGSGG